MKQFFSLFDCFICYKVSDVIYITTVYFEIKAGW